MGDNSRIEWTDATWNPTVGCTRVSAGCDNCYAVRESLRLAGHPNEKLRETYSGLVGGSGKRKHFTGVVKTLADRLDQPLRWQRPRRIFVNSMSDLFHPAVPDEFIVRVWATMLKARHHTFQVLTKRPERMAEWVRRFWREAGELAFWSGEDPPAFPLEFVGSEEGIAAAVKGTTPHIWLGTSVEDQAAADERIPHLVRTPAAVRFLSCEPLLGSVDLRHWIDRGYPGQCYDIDGNRWHEPGSCAACRSPIHQVIVGGESGPGARPMHPDWARSLRDQCRDAGVAFHFKQWGEWCPAPRGSKAESLYLNGGLKGGYFALNGEWGGWLHHGRVPFMARVGKKAAGRELDGRTWDEEPEVTHGRA